MLHATTPETSNDTLDYLTHADGNARHNERKRNADNMTKGMVLNDTNMQFCGSEGCEWVRYMTTKQFKETQSKSKELVMKFNRDNPLVLTDTMVRTLNSGNSKYTMRFDMMQNNQSLPDEMQRVRDEVVQHVKNHDPKMAHITADNVPDNLVIEAWVEVVNCIKGVKGATLRMLDDMPVGIDITENSQDGVDVGDFEDLGNVPMTAYVPFEGYYYSKTDTSKVRISWGFLKIHEGRESQILAKVYTDISVKQADDDGTSGHYSALMNDL